MLTNVRTNIELDLAYAASILVDVMMSIIIENDAPTVTLFAREYRVDILQNDDFTSLRIIFIMNASNCSLSIFISYSIG